MDLDQQPPTPGTAYVRPAQDEDLDQLVELAAAFYRQDRFATAREHLRVMLGGAGYVSVAVRSDRVVVLVREGMRWTAGHRVVRLLVVVGSGVCGRTVP